MKPIVLCLMVLMLIAAPVVVIQAQQDPDYAAREAAIVHLNQAIPGIGRPDRWEWESIGLVNNTSLNCPLATGTPLSNPVTVLKITLFYDATTYLYHVSSDGAIVVPCDSKIPGGGGAPPSLATCTFNGATTVNVYQSPIRSSAVLGTLGTLFAGSTSFNATGRNAATDWLMVTYGGGLLVGWVGVSDITNVQGQCNQLPITDTAAVPTTCTLTANRANIRQEPTTESLILGEILTGTVVNVVGRTADSSWWQILGGGWVASSVVTTSGTGCAALPVTGVTTIDYGDCPPNYLGYRVSRLDVGDAAMVDDESDVPNRVRSKPSISAEILFQLQAGDTFDVVDGPQCGNGIVWWFIEADGRFGWTAESEVSTPDYFVEPIETTVTAAQFPCPVGFSGYLSTRLGLGQSARVAANIVSGINLYQRPSILSQSGGLLSAGTTLAALSDGPACNEGLVWWNTTVNGVNGWVPESNAGVGIYYLEPTTTAAAQGAINPANVTQLTLRQTLPAFVNDSSRMAWSPTGAMLAVSTVEGLKIYSYPTLQPNAQLNAALALPTTTVQVTAFAFDATGNFLALGFADGKVQLFNLNTAAVNVLVADNRLPVTSIVFAPNGTQLLASAQVGSTPAQATDFSLRTWTFDPTTGGAIPVLNLSALAHPAFLKATFAPDGSVAALSTTGVRSYQPSGFVQEASRLGNSPILLPADPAWFNSTSYVLFGTLTGIQGFNTTDGSTPPQLAAALSETASALAAAQPPAITGQTPLLAVVISDLSLPSRMVGFYSSAGMTSLHSFNVEGARDLAFSPDGRVLAILGTTGVQFWSAP